MRCSSCASSRAFLEFAQIVSNGCRRPEVAMALKPLRDRGSRLSAATLGVRGAGHPSPFGRKPFASQAFTKLAQSCPVGPQSRPAAAREMARLAFAVVALLLAGQGCAAVDTTTVAEERRLETTESPQPSTSEPLSAAPRTGGLGPLVLALLALLLSGNGCTALDTTTLAEERRLETTESPQPSTSEPLSAAPRTGGLGPLVLALLALLLSGNGCTALDTTTLAEERRLETTESPQPSTSEPLSAAPRASGPGLMIVLGAALGLGARR
ncbi:unnamed protein product [Prorocentrum cordatum]|uniref:Uncharacterized protein n=1 Tax=Prorocentrum cordatum TaxID=2364126 RepID=A0ABN9SDU1_9DINO|nr:unnamed protein product [Polarella glacialis]